MCSAKGQSQGQGQGQGQGCCPTPSRPTPSLGANWRNEGHLPFLGQGCGDSHRWVYCELDEAKGHLTRLRPSQNPVPNCLMYLLCCTENHHFIAQIQAPQLTSDRVSPMRRTKEDRLGQRLWGLSSCRLSLPRVWR